MMNICAKNQGNRGESCISGVSVLQKVMLKDVLFTAPIVWNGILCKNCIHYASMEDLQGCHQLRGRYFDEVMKTFDNT